MRLMPTFRFDPVTPEVVVTRLVRGLCVADEMLLEAAEGIMPALLPDGHMVALRRELDPRRSRRGRPVKGSVGRKDLAASLAALSPGEAMWPFIDRLAWRMRTGRRFTEYDHAVHMYVRCSKQERDALMAPLYHEYKAAPDLMEETVSHPVLSPITVKMDGKVSRSVRALQVTQHVLREAGYPLLGLASIANTISARAQKNKSAPLI